ncbi:hypothetical protein AMJ83_06000 [candidate division WOR_3 bacterium SM23_42]|uniref:TRAM domain-containing protein n=1 Tax=candidate division WOR_3 bacterium SM23_42 TaxID=1703779 RepID=A0A0S8FSI8_UNCW3|nr:MAG: hypothetical protein AMJ83_06000 [candidate division WOR_3 bacterium SM23_42]
MLFFKRENRFVLDSSSILDGRIIQLFNKRFFEGRIIVPQLVSSIVKKVSGYNGEKTLSLLQKSVPVEFVTDKSNGLIEEVCVLRIADKLKAKVFTTSDELCRQAKSYPKVRVIDIRDLYRALTPIFTPDRLISVRILKKGLRSNEGVGYIEGVKVVVENAAMQVNHVVNARVLTMISSDKGSLVFCSLQDGQATAKRYRKPRR